MASEDALNQDIEDDVPMTEDQAVEIGDDEGDDDAGDDATALATQDASFAAVVNPQTIFLDYLRSPIVSLTVGPPDSEQAVLLAHRAILTRAPFFADALSDSATSSLTLEDEDLDAVVCFLQYQYTGEYFPRRVSNEADGLETDPSLPSVDTTGDQLLKHAKVYTFAEKIGLPDLKGLAHSKIHRINSTAVGEIAYARYVYGHTSPTDVTIRRPVAAFWATRSHVLRHEAEQEFRTMCLEFPQFGFDVLSLVLDQREKKTKDREDVEGTPQSGGIRSRKRMRPSVNV